jgi:hypothetical protein
VSARPGHGRPCLQVGDGATHVAIDTRYGEGIVELDAALRPVAGIGRKPASRGPGAAVVSARQL